MSTCSRSVVLRRCSTSSELLELHFESVARDAERRELRQRVVGGGSLGSDLAPDAARVAESIAWRIVAESLAVRVARLDVQRDQLGQGVDRWLALVPRGHIGQKCRAVRGNAAQVARQSASVLVVFFLDGALDV